MEQLHTKKKKEKDTSIESMFKNCKECKLLFHYTDVNKDEVCNICA